MQNLIKHIESIVKLTQEAKDALFQLANIEQYSKNEYILATNQRCNHLWFLSEGMVRKYYLHDGKEITTWIHTKNEIFTSLQSYSQNSPSEEYLQACEDCVVIGISKQNSEKLSKFPQFVQYSNTLMEREFVNIDKHTKALNQRDAKAKYEYLQEIAPEMIKKAKLGHIASILGITQETLSRIRRG